MNTSSSSGRICSRIKGQVGIPRLKNSLIHCMIPQCLTDHKIYNSLALLDLVLKVSYYEICCFFCNSDIHFSTHTPKHTLKTSFMKHHSCSVCSFQVYPFFSLFNSGHDCLCFNFKTHNPSIVCLFPDGLLNCLRLKEEFSEKNQTWRSGSGGFQQTT